MKNLLTILTLISLTSNFCFADTVAIKQGTPAPYDGVLFSHDKAVETANELVERDLFKSNLTSCNQRFDLQNQINNQLLTQNKALADRNESNETLGFVKIAAIVLATLGAVYVAKKATE